MKKLIIFDLDGTILNTLTDLTISINYMLNHLNLPPRTEEEIKYFLGRGPQYLIEQSVGKPLDNNEYERVYQVYNAHYDKQKNINTQPYQDFDKVFKTLKEKGYLLAVCSNKQHEATSALMAEVFPNIFDVVIGTSPKLNKKPASDMVDHIIKELAVNHENVIYIGDTEIDMQTAINSNIEKVAVLYGFRKKEELEIYKPKYFVNKPVEIIDVIDMFFKGE